MVVTQPYLKASLMSHFLALSLEFEYNYNDEKDLLSHKAFISEYIIVQK